MVAAWPMEITSQAAAAARGLQHIDRNGRNISPEGVINIADKCFRDFRQRLGLSYLRNFHAVTEQGADVIPESEPDAECIIGIEYRSTITRVRHQNVAITEKQDEPLDSVCRQSPGVLGTQRQQELSHAFLTTFSLKNLCMTVNAFRPGL